MTSRSRARNCVALLCASALAAVALASCTSQQAASTVEGVAIEEAVGQPDRVAVHVAYPAYSSVQDLGKAADAIVEGKLVDARVEELAPLPPSTTDPVRSPHYGTTPEELAEMPPMIVTVFTMSVERVVAGAVAEQQIEVMQPGGTFEGVSYETTDEMPLEVDADRRVVLVLADQPAFYDLPNPAISAYEVTGEEMLTPLGPENPLEVDTVGDLENIISEEG